MVVLGLEAGGDADEAVAALLRDTIEDRDKTKVRLTFMEKIEKAILAFRLGKGVKGYDH